MWGIFLVALMLQKFDDPQLLTGSWTINSLSANSANTRTINDISLEKVYIRSHPQKILGEKTFGTIKVGKLQTDLVNQVTIDL